LLCAGALAPDLELLDGGGAEGVAGSHDHAEALVAILLGELADGGRLAAAVDADDQHHHGLQRRVELEGAVDQRQRLRHFLGERRADLLGRHLLIEARAAQALGHFLGDAGAHVGGDEQIFELAQRLVVEPAPREDAADPLAKLR
jgi:hypothetical protein